MCIAIGSTVVIQEDEGPWTHQTTVEKGDKNYSDEAYKIHMTKTGWLIKKQQSHEGYTNHIRAMPQALVS